MDPELLHTTKRCIADGQIKPQKGRIYLPVSQDPPQEIYCTHSLHDQNVVDTSDYGTGILCDTPQEIISGGCNVHQHRGTRVNLN